MLEEGEVGGWMCGCVGLLEEGEVSGWCGLVGGGRGGFVFVCGCGCAGMSVCVCVCCVYCVYCLGPRPNQPQHVSLSVLRVGTGSDIRAG